MCCQRSTQTSVEANIIVQGIYQQNMENRHRIYFTELVILQYIMLPYLSAFPHAVPSAWDIFPLPTSTFRNGISYPFFASQFRCTFSKKSSLIPQNG